MEAASIFSPSIATPISNTPSVNRTTKYCKSKVEFACCNRRRCCYNLIGNRRWAAPSAASNDVSSVADPVTAEVTWQIIVGAIAGVTPFVVAGIEFSKRIIAQRRCEVCGGAGLVLREKDYFKCPECGMSYGLI
ncbi:hypothetical protein CICLE_v10009869mg [Citrus x clementina]|uniref:Viral late gene transcription factor 3 zinc ribbon domain-containing protein n=1 Tax=Citrus clementina TaxID=85681 RepID=V4UT79_CITCL|nr:hypothetical protein CICLE_v10009869mg [Citrus x clementina]